MHFQRGLVSGLHAQFVGFGFAFANVCTPGLANLIIRRFTHGTSGWDTHVHMRRANSSGVFLWLFVSPCRQSIIN